MSERYEELQGEDDAQELGRVATLLDPSNARGPRPEFLAALRARMRMESPRPSLWERLALWRGAPPRGSTARGGRLAWVASLAVITAVAALVATTLLAPSGNVAIAGERVVLLSSQGFVTYDPGTLELKERVNVPAPEPWVMLAPDRRTLVFTFGVEPVRRMRVYDLGSTAERPWQDIAGLNAPRQFALSADGALAYVRDGDAIRIVDLPGRSVLGAIPTPGIGDSPVYLAPDGRDLFQFLPEGALVQFEVATRRESRRVPVDFREPDEVGLSASPRIAFGPDGRTMYAVGSTGSPTGPVRIRVYDRTTLSLVRGADIDPARIRVVSRHETFGDQVAKVLGRFGFVAVAKELGTVTQIALSPDGRRLYAARGSAGAGVLVVEAGDLQPLGLVQANHSVYGIQLTADGRRLFALATPKDTSGDAVLLALDSGTYAVAAQASTRVAADTAAIIVKP
jgi:hypothetical protein